MVCIEIKNLPSANWIVYNDTMLEYYLGINPQKLTNEQWAEKLAMLEDIKKKEAGKG